MSVIPYFDQLRLAAKKVNYPLKQAFIDADIETSTYYRTRNGTTLRLTTAEKVMAVLDHIKVTGRPPAQPD